MEFAIHDVGHGQCISFRHDNGHTMLWDCGRSDVRAPSQFLSDVGWREATRFFVTNYDEDHINDLPNLRRALALPTLHRNTSISAAQLRSLKLETGPISTAMSVMADMAHKYNTGPPSPAPALPGVYWNTYHNDYLADFTDTNNISLVTFLHVGNVRVIIPGDLERPGWEKLLRRDDFRAELEHVQIFIAPHHGRENGYHKDVFNFARNVQVVVFSDSPQRFATQEMANVYGDHASGITWNGRTRNVLSTRQDGTLQFAV